MLGESSLFFLSDQRGDLVAMVKEVAEPMIDLGLGQTEVFADFLNGFAALVKRGDLPDVTRKPSTIGSPTFGPCKHRPSDLVQQPLSMSTLPRLAKYPTDIKSLMDSELRSALQLVATAPYGRK
jgi:hypothetical protein